ncbi:MAG: GHMP kinase [Kiritimatiellae bacterium]|nr:GHMP kinase [Kiritimatiellia bacterium]MBP5228245.1 GHMP kinase [Kiritimatiellia bacterium]
MLLTTRSYARAGLVGNPSDGYFGKTLSFTFKNFCSEVTMYETPELGFIPGDVDDATFDSPEDLLRDIQLFGYYGGIRLLKAISKLFFEYCGACGYQLPKRNFTVRYRSNIPRLVGLSGSSAICTAMLKALQSFYGIEIPLELAPTLCLEAERDELGIQCGLQDRVIQIYNGLVFMDFDRSLIESQKHGRYERLDVGILPKLFISFDPKRAEISGTYHRKLRVLFEEKKPDIVAAMSEFADLAQQARDALVAGHPERLNALIDANFDLRDRIFNVAPANRRMVMTARGVGCSAKFAGSGGAIVGTYGDEEQFTRLTQAMAAIGCTTIKPQL